MGGERIHTESLESVVIELSIDFGSFEFRYFQLDRFVSILGWFVFDREWADAFGRLSQRMCVHISACVRMCLRLFVSECGQR